MNHKKFFLYRIFIVIIIASLISNYVVNGNFIIPLFIVLLAMIGMFFLRRRVDGVLTDERVDAIAGKAARITFFVSVMVLALGGLVIIALRESYPEYYLIGIVAAYFSAGMLVLYSLLFKYYFSK